MVILLWLQNSCFLNVLMPLLMSIQIQLQDSIYVLPLVIYGIPVRMACPSIAPKPPSVSCHESGMTVKVESSISVKDIKVKGKERLFLCVCAPKCAHTPLFTTFH